MTASPSPSTGARDRHLFGPGPKRLLALDGGGVRGLITVAFLERIEAVLSQLHGRDVRLGEYFDLVGGTSTGSIIASAIALGYRAAQIKDLYFQLAPYVFKRQFRRIPVLQAKFDAGRLRQHIQAMVGDRTLSSPDLITGLCVIAKRMDTGSPWIIANNPCAPFWEDGPDFVGNRHYSLAGLVRASTAAPHYFDPEIIAINQDCPLPDAVAAPTDRPWTARLSNALLERSGLRRRIKIDSKKYGLFVDGGVTPHNNPALALFHMTQFKRFGLAWAPGPDRLAIVSVGTGSHRPLLSFESLGFARFPKLAYHALTSLMTDAEMLVLAQMQWMGECLTPWVINSEVGTLADDVPLGGKMFRFSRYDVRLERQWIARELGLNVSERDLRRYRLMDDPRVVQDIHEIARVAAERQVKPAHWGVSSEISAGSGVPPSGLPKEEHG